jgi:two-component system, NtrC family, sensor kinase
MVSVVQTIRDRCRRCYHCVRHCPARAVRVVAGQAEVVPERCIACGNCYRVCAQRAKEIEDGIARTRALLDAGGPVIAALAPSFPAAFQSVPPGQVVGAVRRLGFSHVMEVAFGADLVARRYCALAPALPAEVALSSPCPALVAFVEKFYPALVPRLVPIVSPMIAFGRAVKGKLHPDARIVFIGPCAAKKREADDPRLAGAIDAVLTFDELHRMLEAAGVDPAACAASEPDPPRGGLGRVFPVSGGLLRTADIPHDVLDSTTVVADGVFRVPLLLNELMEEAGEERFVDILFCEGCVNGPVMATDAGPVSRCEAVTGYARAAGPALDEAALAEFDDVDLARTFLAQPVDPPPPSEEQIREVLSQVHKYGPEDELNCGACGYTTCREKAIAVCHGLAEVGMCLPYLIEEAENTLRSLSVSNAELASAQERLVSAEKLATMGQLAAGVAHQLNNPLGTVLLYGHMLLKQLRPSDSHHEDLQIIVSEAMRCKNIVVDLLNFARQTGAAARPFDINALLDGIVELALAGRDGRISVERALAPDLPELVGDPEQVTQALMNIVGNALDAMPEGGVLHLRTRLGEARDAIVEIADTGPGIPPEVLPRIFDPFYTTKPVGQGTGLGLAIARSIIKAHSGDIEAGNAPEGGACFRIRLPFGERANGEAHTDLIG